jgi:oxalate decarboxylase/phosphoglucose isomerase-like protein (cupin superfamily)
MSTKIQITPKHNEWETSELHPGLRWQFSVNRDVTNSNGLSCGYLQLEVGAELPLHFHNEQEIYIITKGRAELQISANKFRTVNADDTIYIPEKSWHGIRNIGVSKLEFVWIFPTDRWQDVKYVFADETFNQPNLREAK